MVILLNYLPLIIFAVGAFAFYKVYKSADKEKRNKRLGLVAVLTIASLVAVNGLTSGYIPKQRSSEVGIPMPAFEPRNTKIDNRLREPMLNPEESDERFQKLTDWRQNLRDAEEKAKADSEE